jgi:hypothetical protein
MGIQVKKWISNNLIFLYSIGKQTFVSYLCLKKSGWNIEV